MRLTSRLRRVERTQGGRCPMCTATFEASWERSKEWQELRWRIVQALHPFPEAKQAVLDALREDEAR